MKSALELAHRIETGIETKSGRYDWASKVEVLAFVRKEAARLEREMRVEIARNEMALRKRSTLLEVRIAELETPWLTRLMRRFRGMKP